MVTPTATPAWSATRTIAVVGATGAVGREMLDILADRGVCPSRLTAFASARSAGSTIPYAGTGLPVDALDVESLHTVDADIVLLAVSAAVARRIAPILLERGALVVDNSSAFRMEPSVPLIVPEVNGDELDVAGDDAARRLIANPNCSTIVMLLAIDPIHRLSPIRRIVVSTYQAVSGAGAEGLAELHRQSRAVALGEAVPSPVVFGEPSAANVFSHDSPVDPVTGENEEESKLRRETRRIWDAPDLLVTSTCIRVPVERAHTEAITITVERPLAESDIRAALDAAPGIRVVDDRVANRFPTPLAASGQDDVLVGRLRPDPSQPAGLGWCLMASGDQLRKGAALNAIQIVERALAANTR